MAPELRTKGTFPISALRPFCTVSFCTVALLHCGFSAQCQHADLSTFVFKAHDMVDQACPRGLGYKCTDVN